MHGDLLDLVLLAACVLFGYSGYRQGFVTGALTFLGILGGGYLGTKVAVPVVHAFSDRVSAPVLGIIVVFFFASVGQVLAATLGSFVRSRVTFRSARLLDSAGGALLSIVAVLLVAWLVGTSITQTSLTGISRQVRDSRVIAAVNTSIPPSLRATLAQFRRLVNNTGFPAIVGPLAGEPAAPVPAPDPAVLASAGVRAARPSVVKITGTAPSCSRRLEGTGFVYAPGRVMTNAHVLAGVRNPTVQTEGGGALAATVVLYDPNRDVAVLAVRGLSASPLAFAGAGKQGANAVVAGYPEDGPFTAVAARIRQREQLEGPNIYQSRTVTREVYAIRAQVLPGNSGGPLLDASGSVYGVVFAASTTQSSTGYALTAAEVASDASAGRSAQNRVATGSCD